jgi:hypothetical protein
MVEEGFEFEVGEFEGELLGEVDVEQQGEGLEGAGWGA